MKVWLASLALACGLLMPELASAASCKGPLPTRAGESFAGRVIYVGDGDGICVEGPRGRIKVRLGDFDAPELREFGGPEAKLILRRIAEGRTVRCRVVRGRAGRTTSYDRVIAVCTLNGRRLGETMRARGAPEGGR